MIEYLLQDFSRAPMLRDVLHLEKYRDVLIGSIAMPNPILPAAQRVRVVSCVQLHQSFPWGIEHGVAARGVFVRGASTALLLT